MFKNKWLLPFSLIFGLICILFIWFGDPDFVYKITREDGSIEYLTALFYFLGVVLGGITIFKSKKKLLFPIVWTLLCFVFLGEETSWFQRVFNYSVPAVEQVSAQKEFNLHNLEIFKGDHLFVDGKLSNAGIINFLKSTQNIFRLGFFGYFLVIPILMFNKKIKNFLLKIGYQSPSFKFILFMLIVLVLSFVLAILSPENVKMAMAETREMLYAYYIFIYIGIYYWQKRSEAVSI